MNERYDLRALGWDEAFEEAFEPFRDRGSLAARVAVEHRGALVLLATAGEVWGEISGALRHRAAGRADLPAVGDWVTMRMGASEGRATVEAVLPRRTRFSRNMAGLTTDEQVIAANVDIAFLVSALNSDLNPRQIERYLTMAWSSGASPEVVLTKADLCPDLTSALTEVQAVAPGVPIHITSAVTGEGIEGLSAALAGHKTGVLLGSSGVGKSTLVNELVGEERQTVRDIRDDGKGRHTTTKRELIVLDTGGLLIDTPGMRELQLWDDNDGLDDAFADISRLAEGCRFRDCRHEREPGCAVVSAVEEGSLPRGRYDGFKKLERELEFLHRKQDRRAAAVERRKWRAIAKDHRARERLGRGSTD